MNVFGSNNTVDKGTLETDTVENVLVLGNKNSASIDNKASASRDSGTPTVSGAIGIGNGVVLGEENATAIGNGSKSTALNSFAAGQDAEAAAENTTAIGFGATSSKKNALAFGTGASASETDLSRAGILASSMASICFHIARPRIALTIAELQVSDELVIHKLRVFVDIFASFIGECLDIPFL